MTADHKYVNSANFLLDRISRSTSPFHAVLTAGEDLDDAGFISLDFSKDWELELEYGGKYYVTVYDSTLIAFTIGQTIADEGNLRLAMAHTDFPCFKIKPNPEMRQNGYGRLNVEPYGGISITPGWTDPCLWPVRWRSKAMTLSIPRYGLWILTALLRPFPVWLST